jgi:hypothetical protein
MIALLVWFLIILVIFAVAWWAIGQIPLPPPLRMIANVILAIVAIIVLLWLAQDLAGPPRLHPLF